MSEGAPIQYNFKTPAGTLINIRAESPEQLGKLLDTVSERAGLVAEIEELLKNSDLVVKSLGATQVPATSAPAAAPAAAGVPEPAGDAPACPHGQRVYRTGVGKRGPWSAYFCPAPKDTPGKCEPQWIK